MKTITKVAITVLLLIVAVSVLFTVLPAKEEMVKVGSEDVLTETQFREQFISGFSEGGYFDAGVCTYERLYSKYGFEGFKEMAEEGNETGYFKQSDIDITENCMNNYPTEGIKSVAEVKKELYLEGCGVADPFCDCSYEMLSTWYGPEEFNDKAVNESGDITDEALTLISYCF